MAQEVCPMQDYISASEIGEYLYCQRAWWLRRRGVKSSKQTVLDAGTQQHEALAQAVEQVGRGSRSGRRLLWFGIALLVLFVLIRLLSGV
jgi:CRISPR/Cas system-associated exonuclease Cas4 (RecB family)